MRGGNWWLGKCGAGAEFCCKIASHPTTAEDGTLINSPLRMPEGGVDNNNNNNGNSDPFGVRRLMPQEHPNSPVPSYESADDFVGPPSPQAPFFRPEEWGAIDFARLARGDGFGTLPHSPAGNGGSSPGEDTAASIPVDPSAKAMPDTFWPQQAANQFMDSWRTDFEHWVDYLNRLQAEAQRTKYWTETNNDMARHWIASLAALPKDAPLSDKIERAFDAGKNLITYRTDALTFNTPDFWATPMQIFDFFQTDGKAYGDCEDYSTTRYVALRKFGVPAEAMRIAIFSSPQGPHAAILVNNDGSVISLDNQRVRAVEVTEQSYPPTHYSIVYSVNEAGAWLHVVVPSQRTNANDAGNNDDGGADGATEFLSVRERIRQGTVAPYTPVDEHDAAHNEGTVTHAPMAYAARQACERAVGAYILGATHSSLAVARMRGVKNQSMKETLSSVWKTDNFKKVIAFMVDRVLRFEPKADGMLPRLGHGQAEMEFRGHMAALAMFHNGEYANVWRAFRSDGVLKAAYLMYLEIVVDERVNGGNMATNDRADPLKNMYREAGSVAPRVNYLNSAFPNGVGQA